MKNCTVMVKPASSRCNFACSYCFYHATAATRLVPDRGLMTDETAQHLIIRLADYCPEGSSVGFVFQGGEPLLAGLSFFEHFVKEARALLQNRSLSFCLQTNGSLLTDEICAFLKENNFLVGLSLDGKALLHDKFRKDASGCSTHAKAFAAVKLLKKSGVDFNILSVVTDESCKEPKKLFEYFKDCGFEFVQFIPCMPPENGKAPLSPLCYADFLKKTFSLWLKNGKRPEIRFFANLEAMLSGEPPEQCGANGRCTPQLTVESDGSVYPCDFYAQDRFLCGNINSNSIAEIEKSAAVCSFLSEKVPVNTLCTSCRYLPLCGSGCKRSRPMLNAKKNYCPMKDFFDYAIR